MAITLIGVGLWAFYRVFKEQKRHSHPHIHAENGITYIHTHKHGHHQQGHHEHTHKKRINQSVLSSFGIGFLHGLAGIAHFLLLLPALSFETYFDGVQYVSGFAIGTVIAMTTYTLVLGKLVGYTKKEHDTVLFKGIRFAGGLFAIVIGVYWLYLSF